jgi:predicted amino acid racemase
MNNTRRNHLLTYKGETKNITEWAKITGISVTALTKRIRRNWTIERALETK